MARRYQPCGRCRAVRNGQPAAVATQTATSSATKTPISSAAVGRFGAELRVEQAAEERPDPRAQQEHPDPAGPAPGDGVRRRPRAGRRRRLRSRPEGPL